MTSESSCGIVKPPAKTHRKGNAFVVNALGLGPRHRPHDGRVLFVTTAKKAGVDEHVIKKIVGHCIDDVAEKSYTKRDIEWIRHFMQCIVPS